MTAADSAPLRILMLCTGNSCRSQMAEGWLRHLGGARVDVASAGVEAHGLNPGAVATMARAGLDISGHTSQTVDAVADRTWDVVVRPAVWHSANLRGRPAGDNGRPHHRAIGSGLHNARVRG